jgi:predicted DNA-binding protein (MmcQ/YjbR family)
VPVDGTKLYDDDHPALAEIRKICFALEGVTEAELWGHATFRRGDQLFAVYPASTSFTCSVAFKPDPDEVPSLIQDELIFNCRLFDDSPWLGYDFLIGPLDRDRIVHFIETSYRRTELGTAVPDSR